MGLLSPVFVFSKKFWYNIYKKKKEKIKNNNINLIAKWTKDIRDLAVSANSLIDNNRYAAKNRISEIIGMTTAILSTVGGNKND